MLKLLTLLAFSTNITMTMANSTLEVEVSNIDVKRPGNIVVFMFSKTGFPKAHDKALSRQQVAADQPTISVRFEHVPTEFAIKVLHDEDMTGKVTKNWTGIIPAEGLGFSNGATLGFGPPSFSEAVIKHNFENAKLNIDIIYP